MTKKRSKKILKWTLLPIITLLLIPLICLSTNKVTYSLEVKKQKITNNTNLIQAIDRSLYDKNGNKIILNGVNIGNLFLQEGWLSPFANEPLKNKDGSYKKDKSNNLLYPEFTEDEFREGLKSNPNLKDYSLDSLLDIYYTNFFNEEDVIYIKDTLNLNAIRLPFYYRNILDDDLNLLPKDKAFYYLDYILELCKKHDLYVILDLHGAPGSQNGAEHSGTILEGQGFFKNDVYMDAVISLWDYISNYYTYDNKELGEVIASYDILNEPRIGNISNKTVWNYFDRVYDAIRDNNDQHVITFESCWNFNNLPNPKKYGWKNVQYSYHFYNYNDIPFDLYYFIKDLTNIGRNYNVPTLVGEFTFFEHDDQWKKGLELYKERNYSWTVWTYKAAVTGGWKTSWAVLTKPMQLNKEKEETKTNVSTCSYEEYKATCELMNINNGDFKTSILYDSLKKYN